MGCQCYQTGGPWITYDPDCPAHGDEAQRLEAEREAEQEALIEAAKPKWIKVKDKAPEPGLIVKRFRNGAVWAGMYSGSEKELSFVEYIQLPEVPQ